MMIAEMPPSTQSSEAVDARQQEPVPDPGSEPRTDVLKGRAPNSAGSAPHFLFTGGGTGGHVTPNLAIAEALLRRHPDARLTYVGLRGRSEETMVPRAWGLDRPWVRTPTRAMVPVHSKPWPGLRRPVALVGFAFALLLGVLRAAALLLRTRPRIIVATGAYGAAPVLVAAHLLRRLRVISSKILVHEANAVPGRLVRLATRFADVVGVSFPDARVPPERRAFVGYPVRREIAPSDKTVARARLEVPVGAEVLFAFGGSQGARTLNRAIVDALPAVLARPNMHVLHATGRYVGPTSYDGEADVARRLEAIDGLPEDWERRYRRAGFVHDMAVYYAASDLVVCRGGAGTLAEVCSVGLPSVVIPKANLPGDHQAANARSLERAGASLVIYERIDPLDPESEVDPVEMVPGTELAEEVGRLLDDPARRVIMTDAAQALHSPGSADRIAQLACSLDGAAPRPTLVEPPPPDEDHVLHMSSAALDAFLRGVRRGDAELSSDERRLARYKIDGYLSSGAYVLRARGCRMVGALRFLERAAVLERFAAGRGKDGVYLQLPIVRRDALRGLGDLGEVSSSAREVLLAALSDPYFECRSQAARSIAALAKVDGGAWLRGDAPLVSGLGRAASDRTWEVRCAALAALAEVATDAGPALEAMDPLYFDDVWKVRQAVVEGLDRLVGRGVLTTGELHEQARRVLTTSDGYRLRFPLKESLRGLADHEPAAPEPTEDLP